MRAMPKILPLAVQTSHQEEDMTHDEINDKIIEGIVLARSQVESLCEIIGDSKFTGVLQTMLTSGIPSEQSAALKMCDEVEKLEIATIALTKFCKYFRFRTMNEIQRRTHSQSAFA